MQMKASMRFFGLALASLCMSLAAQPPQHAPHWEYTGDDGPTHWSTLAPEFAACAGRNQSPIDLDNFIEAELPAIAFDYEVGGHDVVNNGHAIQVNYDAGSSISIDDDMFALKQFHFHAPSENHIDGKSFPIEAHFIHVDAKGGLAVVAVMFVQGDSNPALDKLWVGLPGKVGPLQALSPEIAAADLLPGDRDYYRYEGSLTPPPCSEGVRWLVLKQPVPVSLEQIDRLTTALGHPTTGPCSPSAQESSCNRRFRLVPLPDS
jgi:carbonic anhydrase